MKLNNVWHGLPIAACTACLALSTAGQTLVSIAFMLGFYPALMAKLLLMFLVPVTFLVHDFWTIQDEHPAFVFASLASERTPKEIRADANNHGMPSRAVANFPTEFDNEVRGVFLSWPICSVPESRCSTHARTCAPAQ
jgi:hypothetical protein